MLFDFFFSQRLEISAVLRKHAGKVLFVGKQLSRGMQLVVNNPDRG